MRLLNEIKPSLPVRWYYDEGHYQKELDAIAAYRQDGTAVTLIAGTLGDKSAPASPPNSWAADAANDVAIWTDLARTRSLGGKRICRLCDYVRRNSSSPW